LRAFGGWRLDKRTAISAEALGSAHVTIFIRSRLPLRQAHAGIPPFGSQGMPASTDAATKWTDDRGRLHRILMALPVARRGSCDRRRSRPAGRRGGDSGRRDHLRAGLLAGGDPRGVGTVAHEAIFEMRRELIARDRSGPEQARLLAESARIVTVDLPALTAAARRLAGTWQDQDVLDPKAAETTLAELEAELARIRPEVSALLGRQREIAARLRSMREP
jgi:hypothetical protein